MFQSFGAVLDAVDSIRNNASLAHANENLLEVEDAYLVINAVNTVLHIFGSKTGQIDIAQPKLGNTITDQSLG
ncbi:MAG: abortive infection family protein [Anaerolineae bacterium]|nr:abortive infection family protein [Anaerolineae bacterium]